MGDSISDRILRLAGNREIVRPRDLAGVANAGPQFRLLTERGVLLRVGRGLYTLADRQPSASFSINQALARVPSGIVCLVSALEFHGFTTQVGYRVWIAVGDKRPLRIADVPVRIVRMTGRSFGEGVEEHAIGGATIRVFSPAKTIADCFKFRRLVGLDVALEALREGWRERKFSVDDLMACARVDRVEKLVMPYVEMLVA